jgi:hypothetical protein
VNNYLVEKKKDKKKYLPGARDTLRLEPLFILVLMLLTVMAMACGGSHSLSMPASFLPVREEVRRRREEEGGKNSIVQLVTRKINIDHMIC